MLSDLIKGGAVACALGGFAFVAPAQALSSLALNGAAPLAIPVIDEGTAIEQLERPNEVAPGSQKEKGPEAVAPEQPAQGDSSEGDEEQELKRAFPSTEWPPDK